MYIYSVARKTLHMLEEHSDEIDTIPTSTTSIIDNKATLQPIVRWSPATHPTHGGTTV